MTRNYSLQKHLLKTTTFDYWLYDYHNFWKQLLEPDGIYMKGELNYALKIIKSLQEYHHINVVIDIGAHIGQNSLHFSNLCHRVYAFEANPDTFSLLTDNINQNRCTNIIPTNIALGDRDCITFYDAKRRANDGTCHVLKSYERNCIEVPMIRLDKFIHERSISAVSYIKIDTEGFEFQVLQGALETLALYRPVVMTEISTAFAHRYIANSEYHMKDLFQSLNYVGPVGQNGRIYETSQETNFGNFWWFPKELYHRFGKPEITQKVPK